MQPLVVRNEFLQINEEDYQTILTKIGLKDEMVRNSIESIKDWYKMQFHFPEYSLSDGHIFRFLLVNNFSLERTKKKIDNLFTARTLIPEMTTDRDPYSETMKSAFECSTFAVIPKYLDDMTRLVIFGYRSENSSFVFLNYLKLLLMGHEYLTLCDVSLGYHYIFDWKEWKTSIVTQITPTMLRQCLTVFTECFGTKIKTLHYVNMPAYAEILINIVKTMLSKKMNLRVVIHKDPEGLQNYFPKSILPSDFGGENKSMEEFTQDLRNHFTLIREESSKLGQQKTDESKRVGVGNAVSKELQGIQGSFRSLDID